jgi:hypothetical protein
MNPLWPAKRSLADTIKSMKRINEALDWVATDLTLPTVYCRISDDPRGGPASWSRTDRAVGCTTALVLKFDKRPLQYPTGAGL